MPMYRDFHDDYSDNDFFPEVPPFESLLRTKHVEIPCDPKMLHDLVNANQRLWHDYTKVDGMEGTFEGIYCEGLEIVRKKFDDGWQSVHREWSSPRNWRPETRQTIRAPMKLTKTELEVLHRAACFALDEDECFEGMNYPSIYSRKDVEWFARAVKRDCQRALDSLDSSFGSLLDFIC